MKLGLSNSISNKSISMDPRVDLMIQASYRQKQLQQGIPTPKNSPKKFMGRCQPPRVVRTPQVELTHKSRPGDYHPPNEIHSMAGMKQTRQLRRSRSLMGLMKKYPDPDHGRLTQMQQEWKAIRRSRAFGVLFTEWAQFQPEIGPLPKWLPDEGLLFDLAQIVKFQVDAKIHKDHVIWTRKLAYARHSDVKDQGAKFAYRSVKGPTKPMLTTLHQQIERQVLLAPTDQTRYFEAYGDAMDSFVTTDSAILGNKPVQIHEVYSDRVVLQVNHDLDGDTIQYQLLQHQHIVNEEHICQLLTSHWHHYWTTDENNPSTADLESFQELMSHLTPAKAIAVDTHNIEYWLRGIRDFKAQSSPGFDGITPAELKQLPISAVHDAMTILNSYQDGFPEWFMTARTCPIPKVHGIPSPAQIRPITVMATLYRLWARVIGRQALAALSQSLPPQVTGLLAHRGPI